MVSLLCGLGPLSHTCHSSDLDLIRMKLFLGLLDILADGENEGEPSEKETSPTATHHQSSSDKTPSNQEKDGTCSGVSSDEQQTPPTTDHIKDWLFNRGLKKRKRHNPKGSCGPDKSHGAFLSFRCFLKSDASPLLRFLLLVFATIRLLRSGDVELNPGPNESSMLSGVSDITPINIADAISDDMKIRRLGFHLQAPQPYMDRCLASGRMSGSVTSAAEPPTCPSPSATEDKGKTTQLWSKSIQSTSSMGETNPHDEGGVPVHWEFVTDAPADFSLQDDEAEITCGIRFSPSGAKFKEPVRVTLEHCAHFTDPSQAEIIFYTRSRGMTSFERITASTEGYPRCDVRTKDLDLYLDHFSQWRIATKCNDNYKGKSVKCIPYVKPPVIKGNMHIVVLYVYDDLSEIEMKVEEEMTSYEKLHPPKPFFVAWRSGDVIIKLFEGPRRHRTLVDEKVMSEQKFYQVGSNPQSFLVEPPEGEADQKLLEFVLGQDNPKSTDEEMLIVLTYADRVQPLPPPSLPQSQTPSCSSSLPQSPLPRPSQPLLPASVQPSSSSVSSSLSSVSEEELIRLAGEVPSEKYTELCNSMGFGHADSGQVLNKHSKDYKQALTEKLCAWNVNQKIGNSRWHLAEILQKTCLLALAEKLEKGYYLSTCDFESEEPSGTKSEHERDDSAQYPETSRTGQKRKRTKGSSKGPGKKKSKR